MNVQVPGTVGHDGEPFHPQSPERGRRSVRAVMPAVAGMYIEGVSTREVEAVMRGFGIESLSSSQVSRATRLLDDELQAWRNRTPGEVKYLILDARCEKMRHGGVVRDGGVLSALGIGPDDHAVLRAARRAVPGGATWQRCPFHLAQNARHHTGSVEIRKRIGKQPKSVWNANDRARAEAGQADWLGKNVPDALAIFTLPEHHRKRRRTSNPMERAVRQELKRRTVKVRVLPGDDALLRPVSAILVEIDEKRAADTKACIKWGQDA